MTIGELIHLLDKWDHKAEIKVISFDREEQAVHIQVCEE